MFRTKITASAFTSLNTSPLSSEMSRHAWQIRTVGSPFRTLDVCILYTLYLTLVFLVFYTIVSHRSGIYYKTPKGIVEEQES
jgi:hypothetical protein